MLAKLGADGRKSLGEFHHMFVFRALANLTKTRMVAVLLAPLGIATVAWMCPSADGQIQTSVQAGGAIALSRRARRAKRSPRKDSGGKPANRPDVRLKMRLLRAPDRIVPGESL